MRFVYLYCLLSFLLFSCGEADRDEYALVKSDRELVFELDRNVRNVTFSLFPYTDKDGEEYLTFQNMDVNDILFYSMEDQKFRFKIVPEISGNNGVGLIGGYYIHNLDSLFLTVRGQTEIAIINRRAEVVDKLEYETSSDNQPLRPFSSYTSVYHPLVVEDSILYLFPKCNRWTTFSPMCVGLNMKTRETKRYPMNYPRFEGADNRAKLSGAVEIYVSRCFNGKEFVYSFYYDESIYITSINQERVERKPIKSRYLDKIVFPDDYGRTMDRQDGFKQICERSHYGSMRYDPYRDVYYRVAYPKTEIEPGVNTMELMQYGRKVFSIIIADNRFNVIGETLFPAYRYNPDMMFIREDGLYISASHPMSPDFSDDELRFHRFELRKK